MTDQPLSGRTSLVTGANHGIGAATAVALAALGSDIAVTYLRLDAEDGDSGRPADYARARSAHADTVAAEVERAGVRCLTVEADLSDPATPTRIFDEVEAALGPVSVLVNNASGWRQDTFAPETGDRFGRPTALMNADSFDAQFLVDARASALLISELARRQRDRGDGWGRIVSLTSGGPNGFPGEASYGAAKAALENYTMTAAIELADAGTTANVVHPPVTDTGWITDDVRAFVASSTEHVHIADPADVAEVIAWLCTDAAALVTGNVLRLR